MQLKLQMENFLQNKFLPKKDESTFVYFLKLYIDSLYSKRIQFAEDINIPANLLSKIMNQHREPNDEFIQKLIVHSEKTYNNKLNFNATIWYHIFYTEKIKKALAQQDNWRLNIEKQITAPQL